jgi:hypothetical protein
MSFCHNILTFCHITFTNKIQNYLDNIYVSKINNMNKIITIKIDEDNDIYEMTVNNEVYTLDNVYESKYAELFDELNFAIEIM